MTAPARPDTMFRSLNPATGELFASYHLHGEAEVNAALERSFAAWRTIKRPGSKSAPNGWWRLPIVSRTSSRTMRG